MNTVRSAPLRDGERVEIPPLRPSLSINQLVAVLLWALACVTSWQLVAAITPGMDARYQIAIGIALQAIFTALERPALRGRPNKVSALVLFLDTLVNAGGIFPFALRMSGTPTAAMVSQTFNMAPQMSNVAAFGVAFVLGFLLAAAPEAVWRWRG